MMKVFLSLYLIADFHCLVSDFLNHCQLYKPLQFSLLTGELRNLS